MCIRIYAHTMICIRDYRNCSIARYMVAAVARARILYIYITTVMNCLSQKAKYESTILRIETITTELSKHITHVYRRLYTFKWLFLTRVVSKRRTNYNTRTINITLNISNAERTLSSTYNIYIRDYHAELRMQNTAYVYYIIFIYLFQTLKTERYFGVITIITIAIRDIYIYKINIYIFYRAYYVSRITSTEIFII